MAVSFGECETADKAQPAYWVRLDFNQADAVSAALK